MVVSDIAIFVLKRVVKLQLTNLLTRRRRLNLALAFCVYFFVVIVIHFF